MTSPWKVADDGIRLAVRLTPNAKRASLEGVGTDVQGRPLLLIRISAPPVDGQANRALVSFLAKAMGLRQSDVSILSGENSRTKILRIAGDPAGLIQRMRSMVG